MAAYMNSFEKRFWDTAALLGRGMVSEFVLISVSDNRESL